MSAEWKRKIVIAGIVIGVYAMYRWLFPVMIPFLFAWFLAELFYPLTIKIERKVKIKRTISGVFFLLISLGGAAFIIFWGMSELWEQIQKAVRIFPRLEIWISKFLDFEMKEEILTATVPNLVKKVLTGAKTMIFFVSAIVVTVISYVLLLGDMERIKKTVREYSYLKGVFHVWRRLKKTTITYLKAQLVIIMAVAIVCSIGLWIMGNAYFLLLGIMLAVFDAFPIIGTGAFLYPAAVILVVKKKFWAAAGCVILDLVTSVLREILEPKLLGAKLGIPSIFILMSVYVGVFLYGAAGVFLGPLSFSTMYEIGREWDVWGE